MRLRPAAPFAVLLLILGGCSSDGSHGDPEAPDDGSELVSEDPSEVEGPTAPTANDGCLARYAVAVVGLDRVANLRSVGEDGSTTRYDLASPSRLVAVDDYLLSATTVVMDPTSRPSDDSTEEACPDERVGTDQIVSSIDVVSDAPLSEAIPAGALLNDVALVQVPPATLDAPDRRVNLVTSRSDADEERPLSELVSQESPAPVAFTLRFAAEVDAVTEHRFDVTYALEGGDTFMATTAPVTLVPSAGAVVGGTVESLHGVRWVLDSYLGTDGSSGEGADVPPLDFELSPEFDRQNGGLRSDDFYCVGSTRYSIVGATLSFTAGFGGDFPPCPLLEGDGFSRGLSDVSTLIDDNVFIIGFENDRLVLRGRSGGLLRFAAED